MERRKFISTVAAGAVVGLAGCSESDETNYEDGNGGGNGDSSSPNNTGNVDNTNPSSESNNNGGNSLEITEHDLVIDEGEFMTDVYIEGIVKNTGSEREDYVEVSARVYDDAGNQLESYMTNTSDLDPGTTWAFEVSILEEAEDVDTYDISVSGDAI